MIGVLFVNQAVIYHDQLSARESLLNSIGLVDSDLSTTALQCYRAFSSVSPLHPKGYSGTSGWADGTQSLRALLIPKGWVPADPNGQPRVVSPGKRHAITVSSGDSNTGNPHMSPQTRNQKGAQTSRSVEFNSRQGDLFAVSEASKAAPSLEESTEQMLWVFLYYIDIAGEEIRYELSCPIQIGENGKVDEWRYRIIMPALRLSNTGNHEEADHTDHNQSIDVPVIPKL